MSGKVRQHNYNALGRQEIEDIENQISKGMRMIDGDTASIKLTARQAAILLWAYKKKSRPSRRAEIYSDIIAGK